MFCCSFILKYKILPLLYPNHGVKCVSQLFDLRFQLHRLHPQRLVLGPDLHRSQPVRHQLVPQRRRYVPVLQNQPTMSEHEIESSKNWILAAMSSSIMFRNYWCKQK